MPQPEDLLQIKFCRRGKHGLKFIVHEVMSEKEIADLNRRFRRYRRLGFRMVNGFTPVQARGTVTLEIEQHPWRRSLSRSPQAVDELAQLIAVQISVSEFELTDDSQLDKRKVTFAKEGASWRKIPVRLILLENSGTLDRALLPGLSRPV